MLSAAATYVSDEVNVQGGVSSDQTIEWTLATVAGTLALRQVVVSHVVDVSIWGGVEAGRAWVGGDALGTTLDIPRVRPGSRATVLGLVAGLAVERELIEALAVRLSAQIGSARWSSYDTVTIDDLTGDERVRESGDRFFGLAFRPALHIRIYF